MLFAPGRDGSEVFDIVVGPGLIDEPGIKASTGQKWRELHAYIEQHQETSPVSADVAAADLGWSPKELCGHLVALLDRNSVKCRMPSQTAVFRLMLLEKIAGDSR